ncbi:MAG: glycosyltransferase family 4 protein [Verrucomicrobia bacterium]|nr:glycosyltransferase family 4 protein [Verrucomicrobiota bacterium]
MRVGVVTGIFPPDIGGPATFIPALGAGLVERGHRVEVVTYSDTVRESAAPAGEPAGAAGTWPFRVTRIARGSRLRRVHAVGAVLRMAFRSDVLFANGLVETAALAGRLAGRPWVVKIVGDFAWERARNQRLTTQAFTAFQEKPHPGLIARWQRRRNAALRCAAAVMVPSEFLRTVIEGWGIGRPVRVIPNGVDEWFVRAAEQTNVDELRRAHTLPARFLLYGGRLTNWKGCDTLIRLLSDLRDDVALVIVGDGPELEALVGIAGRQKLVDRVHFLPRMGRGALAGLMRAASCVVLNSGYEGHPHVLLEAMAVGTPVAAAAECGTPELVRDGDNGLLFDKDNAPQMREALMRVLDDAALRRRLVAGGRETAARYPWTATLDRTEKLLMEVARRRS